MDRLPAALSALHLSILLFSVFLVYSYVSAKTAPAFLYTWKNKKDLSTRILLQISLAVSNKTRLHAMNVDSVTPEAPTTPLCLLLCGFYHSHYLTLLFREKQVLYTFFIFCISAQPIPLLSERNVTVSFFQFSK